MKNMIEEKPTDVTPERRKEMHETLDRILDGKGVLLLAEPSDLFSKQGAMCHCLVHEIDRVYVLQLLIRLFKLNLEEAAVVTTMIVTNNKGLRVDLPK